MVRPYFVLVFKELISLVTCVIAAFRLMMRSNVVVMLIGFVALLNVVGTHFDLVANKIVGFG